MCSYLPSALGGSAAPAPAAGTSASAAPKPKGKASEAERKFARGRWAFWIGAGAAMVGYLLAAGIVRIELGEEDVEFDDEDEEGQGEMDDDVEEEDERAEGIAKELVEEDGEETGAEGQKEKA